MGEKLADCRTRIKQLSCWITVLLTLTLVTASGAVAHEGHHEHKDELNGQQSLSQQPLADTFVLRAVVVGLLVSFGILGFMALKTSSINLARWGGVAGAVAGMLLVFRNTISLLPASSPWLNIRDIISNNEISLFVSGPILAMLTTAGLVGYYALLETHSWSKVIGVSLACLSVVILALLAVSVMFVSYRTGYSPSASSFPFSIIYIAGWVKVAGFLLLGVVGYEEGVLGRWRILPLALGLLSTPLPELLILSFSPDIVTGPLLTLPRLIFGLGWVMLGYLVAKSSKRLGTKLAF